MTTIRRHAVPVDSYDAERPLNDLLGEQLKHFIHVAQSLPPAVREALPPTPSPEDAMRAGEFIAAVTRILMSRNRPGPNP